MTNPTPLQKLIAPEDYCAHYHSLTKILPFSSNSTLYSLMGLLMVMGALIEGYQEVMKHSRKDRPMTEDNFIIKFVKCFSFNSNGKKILDTQVRGDHHLGCLNGMRYSL